MQSEYMHWAKTQSATRYNLSSSEVPHFRLDRLDLTIAELDLDGASHPRYLPLREAIASKYSFDPEGVVAADGTSMANFLAMAALIAPGDEALVERIREASETFDGEVGISCWNGFAMARFCAQDAARLRADMVAVLGRASGVALPRLWLH
jgi:hypothetical protein